MVLIFTEEQKKEIEENGYWVIQVKQTIYELIKPFNAVNGKRK